MIYLSAQPDDLYFLWQLKLQIFNFKKNNICREQIHILIGYNKAAGLNSHVQAFIHSNQDALFFTYEDTRKNSRYPSSIRPHLLHKHFKSHPYLEKETIFYHDSDILLKKKIEEEDLLQDDTWYVSPAKSYIGCSCIIHAVGEQVFEHMCNIVGINKERVVQNENEAGGAQYILKQVTAGFWKKTEEDCENLYSYLYDQTKNEPPFELVKTPFKLQIWCTDMWVLWWNALLDNREFKATEKLKFCWADSKIEDWKECNILHYTGKINREKSNGKCFRKTDYSYYEPFYDNFAFLDPTLCSKIVVDQIKAYQEELKKDRLALSDLSFVICLEEPNLSDTVRSLALIHYLQKNFRTSICLIEINQTPSLHTTSLPDETCYEFVEKRDDSTSLPEGRVKNIIEALATPYVCLYNHKIVVPIQQIIESIRLLKTNSYSIVYPYNQPILHVDILASQIFQKILDDKLLLENKGKTHPKETGLLLTTPFFKKREYEQLKPFFTDATITPAIQADSATRSITAFVEGFIFQLFSSRKKNTNR